MSARLADDISGSRCCTGGNCGNPTCRYGARVSHQGLGFHPNSVVPTPYREIKVWVQHSISLSLSKFSWNTTHIYQRNSMCTLLQGCVKYVSPVVGKRHRSIPRCLSSQQISYRRTTANLGLLTVRIAGSRVLDKTQGNLFPSGLSTVFLSIYDAISVATCLSAGWLVDEYRPSTGKNNTHQIEALRATVTLYA